MDSNVETNVLSSGYNPLSFQLKILKLKILRLLFFPVYPHFSYALYLNQRMEIINGKLLQK